MCERERKRLGEKEEGEEREKREGEKEEENTYRLFIISFLFIGIIFFFLLCQKFYSISPFRVNHHFVGLLLCLFINLGLFFPLLFLHFVGLLLSFLG